MKEGITCLPDGRIFYDMPYRIDQIPKHFHRWHDWENGQQEGIRCLKCGEVRHFTPIPPLPPNNYVAPAQIHNPRIYDPDTLSEVYSEQAKIIKESEGEESE